MVAYDKKSIEALQINKLVRRWFALGLIEESTKNNLKASCISKFKTTRPIAKVGLFIFTLIASLAVTGFSMLLTSIGRDSGLGFACLIVSVISILLNENLIKHKHYYRSGIDNALTYFSAATFLTSLAFLMTDHPDHTLLLYFIACLLFTALCIRYCDLICTAAAFYCLLAVFYYLLHNLSLALLPFFFMLFAALVYFLCSRFIEKPIFRFHKNNLHTLRLLSLLSFYLAGNYFVIREATENILNFQLKKGDDIPMALFFYLFTAMVPLLYIYWGLQQKDRLILLTGLGITILSALTFKNYFSLGQPEILLSAVGALLILLAYFTIRYLSSPKHGFTAQPDKNHSDLEALVLVQSFAGKPAAPKQNAVQMGGGDFGGGGAGSGF